MTVFSSLNDPQIVMLLRQGKVGVIPTDTIYGLAARAEDQAATARLYQLKHRKHKPGTVLAANIDQLIQLGADESMLRQVQHLWPNPISVVIPASPDLAYLDQNKGDLAVRIPANQGLRRLLLQTGPLLTSSANPPGEPPAATVAEAQTYFGDQASFYADGGELGNRPPSTVVRVVDGKITVLRQGAVTINEQGELS